MAVKKVTKKIYMPEEIAMFITEMAAELGMTESAFVEAMIYNYAIDIGIRQGAKNHILESKELEANKHKKTDIESTLNEMLQELRIMRSILNDIERNAYVGRDLLNAIMIFLRPENEFTTLPSADLKLPVSSNVKLHPFLERSLENYSERIRYNQIEKKNKNS